MPPVSSRRRVAAFAPALWMLVAILLAIDVAVFEPPGFPIRLRRTIPFGRAAEAHRISEGGHVRGKLVLVPAG